jgi:5,5'-dehydrodivanillate O-demethylase
MLDPEDQRVLTQVGPGTPMGELLRRYWIPVRGSSEVRCGRALPVRLLGEDLALFRTTGGALGLVDARCRHRGASLAHGYVDDCAVQCPYHGWRYDAEGTCVGTSSLLDSDALAARATTTAYPVRELGGLVFAYLGPLPAPVLPPYDLLVWDGVLRDIGRAELPCNWLQIMGNSVDPVHVEWLHGHHLGTTRAEADLPVPQRYQRRHREIAFDRFEHGIVKRRVVEGSDRDGEDWRVGHPLVFPLMVRVGAHRQHRLQIRVPVDDTHTLHLWYSCYQPARGAPAVVQDEVPVYDVPYLDEHGDFILDFVDGGDIMTWLTQGAIADRTRELLGDTDRGIVQLRQLLFEQLDRVAAGEDPLGVQREEPPGGVIDLPQESEKYGDGAAFLHDAIAASHVRHSPLWDEIIALLGSPDA